MPYFLSGILLFLLGLEGCKNGLNKIRNEKTEKIITYMTSNLWSSILVGLIFTALLQSSSALSIIIIGLIEADLIKFKAGLAVMFGANIGTTFTVQIISLPILSYYPFLIIIGIIFMVISYMYDHVSSITKKFKLLGFILFSFGVVFAGLNLMNTAFQRPTVYQLLIDIVKNLNGNIYMGIVSGAITTALIQSSSAVTGILVSLISQKIIDLPLAVAIAMGSNIGTCITAFLASLRANKWSKLLALGHFLFNIFGVCIFLFFYQYFISLINISSLVPGRQLANAHTFFNIFTLILILPFFNLIVKLLKQQR